MSTDPFELIAEYFPYKTKIDLDTSEDQARLTLALLEHISNLVKAGVSSREYGVTAARHILYLKKDYGLGYAAAYWEHIKKIPKVRLDESFFKASGVQELIREIVLESQDSEIN